KKQYRQQRALLAAAKLKPVAVRLNLERAEDAELHYRPPPCRAASPKASFPRARPRPPSERLRAFATPCELFATRSSDPRFKTPCGRLAINHAARRKASRRNHAALAIAALAFLFAGVSAAPPAAAAPSSPWVAFQAFRIGQFGVDGVFLVRPDGKDQHEVATVIPGRHIHPDWSSDGHT